MRLQWMLVIPFLLSTNGIASQCSEALTNAYQDRASVALLRGVAMVIVSPNHGTEKLLLGDIKSETELFEIGSVSKSFAGITAALLSLQGKLDLEAPIAKYIPELAGSYMGTVTSHQLATHHARLVRAYVSPSGEVSEQYGEQELIGFLKAYRPDALPVQPRARNYSNVGFGTLGLVLSRIEQKPLIEVISHELLQPLGMLATNFIVNTSAPPGLIQGFDVLLQPTAYTPLSDLAAASGGIYSSTHDMTIYLTANLSPPATLLGQAIKLSHHLGLGWDSDPGAFPIWKNGAMPGGFSSELSFDPTPSKQYGIFALTNTLHVLVLAGLRAIAMAGKDDVLPAQALSTVEPATIAMVTGTYHAPDQKMTLRIFLVGDRLLGGMETLGLMSGPLRFYALNSDVLLVDDGVQIADAIRIVTDPSTGQASLVYLQYRGIDSSNQPVYSSIPLRRD